MDYKDILVLCYCIQIPLAVVALFFMPGRGTQPTIWENLRRNTAILGLLPFAFFSVLMQVLALSIYYLRIRSIRNKEQTAWQKIGGAATPASGANPFGGAAGGAVAPPAAGNPFDSPAGGNGPAGGSAPRANPFL
ncbi:hypothetical protein ACL02T_25600 [Pseudonocardia sp. RS010]|uniref:hypothetical protein n=1 Tax=Pseudonocardia sp. RS010 TaxID=3385979 RepID=UPI0039A20963